MLSDVYHISMYWGTLLKIVVWAKAQGPPCDMQL